jgi:hypothetical protein
MYIANGNGTTIGTTSYASNMILANNATTENSITLASYPSSGNNWTIGMNSGGFGGTNGSLGIYNWGLGKSPVIMTSIGNVGINTTDPQYTLDVNGNINNTGIISTVSISTGSLTTPGATVGTVYANTITTGSVEVSGTISSVFISTGSLATPGATVGTVYANTITTGSIGVSGTISTGSLTTPGATIGTVYANTITTGSIGVSGTISSVSISTGSLATPGATIGTVYANTITTGSIGVSGTISTVSISTGSLATPGVTVGTVYASTITTGSLQVAGALISTGVTTGNINFTGSLYQNGSLYNAGAQSTIQSITSNTLGSLITTTSGSIILNAVSSGSVTFATQNSTGNYNFNLPTYSGTTGQFLLSGGGGTNAMIWSNTQITYYNNLTYTFISGSNTNPVYHNLYTYNDNYYSSGIPLIPGARNCISISGYYPTNFFLVLFDYYNAATSSWVSANSNSNGSSDGGFKIDSSNPTGVSAVGDNFSNACGIGLLSPQQANPGILNLNMEAYIPDSTQSGIQAVSWKCTGTITLNQTAGSTNFSDLCWINNGGTSMRPTAFRALLAFTSSITPSNINMNIRVDSA